MGKAIFGLLLAAGLVAIFIHLQNQKTAPAEPQGPPMPVAAQTAAEEQYVKANAFRIEAAKRPVTPEAGYVTLNPSQQH